MANGCPRTGWLFGNIQLCGARARVINEGVEDVTVFARMAIVKITRLSLV